MKLQHCVFALFSIVTLTFFAACKKKDETPPTVTFTTPTEGDSIAVGATLNISGTVADETALQEAVIEVTKVSDGSSLFTKTIDVTGTSATVTGSYVIAVAAGTEIEVHLEATDEAGNTFDEHAHLHVH